MKWSSLYSWDVALPRLFWSHNIDPTLQGISRNVNESNVEDLRENTAINLVERSDVGANSLTCKANVKRSIRRISTSRVQKKFERSLNETRAGCGGGEKLQGVVRELKAEAENLRSNGSCDVHIDSDVRNARFAVGTCSKWEVKWFARRDLIFPRQPPFPIALTSRPHSSSL